MDTILSSNNLKFIAGTGEMSTLTRAKDWSKTEVGAPETWPQSLLTTLSIVLNSKFPMFLWWGPELICFYNDAYRPSLGQNGKHPSILGMRAEEAWPEIWTIIKPLIDQVLEGGEATWSEDQLIPIFRNGKIEDVYWTFSYSPVRDETSKVAGVLVTCSETTEKVLSIQQLEASRNELAFAIEAIEIGTFDYNPFTKRFSANERLKQWFGLPPHAEVELMHAINGIAEEDKERVMQAIQHALVFSSGGKYDIKYTIIHPISKKKTVVHAKGIAWFNEEKIAYRFNGTLQDITEQKQFENELERQVKERTKELAENNLELARMNKELQSFAYISSHDLQEPLRKIQTFASQILEKDFQNISPKGQEKFRRMQIAAQRMQTLIDDLLAYSRTTTEERVFARANLNEIVEEVAEDLKEDLYRKHASIESMRMCEARIIPFQFRQLVYNLFSNSIKFSKEDQPLHIKVTSGIETGEKLNNDKLKKDESYCHIRISDNGIGFEPQYSEKIFEVFQRLHGKNKYSGTGVGLAIVKRIVENHNGVITATSQLNEGATFDIYIPSI